ncbi:MAG: hypothetical protein JW982_07055 [Spirochaetes bacterium]|nr:hypothetical protein [Spirochaetota bacterium]
MADAKTVKMLDEKLIEMKVLDPQYKNEYTKVHKKLNTVIKKTGAILSNEIFKQGENELREWLMLLYKKGASQEKLTAYLRCGLAHLSFDFIESSYKKIETSDLITRALQSFKKRNYNKTFFKAAPLKLNGKTTKNVKKVKAVKKTKSIKQVKKSKPKIKIPAKKKPVSKKAVIKKTGGKKSAPKKTTAKKSVSKKAKPVKKKVSGKKK